MATVVDNKKIRANWFRKGRAAVPALAVVVFCIYVSATVLSGAEGNLIEGVPDLAVYGAVGGAVMCAGAVFCYQILSIVINRMVFSQEGIEIKRLLKRVRIPKDDVIRIDSVREQVLGAPLENRNIYKIITDTKTYEVTSHEFWGLRQAVQQWMHNHMM